MKFANCYVKHNHSIGIVLYCIEFCTKYRYKMFTKLEYKNLCEACIKKVCFKHNFKILVLKVMPEHTHVIVQCKSTTSLSKAIGIIKGGSSYYFFRRHPKARLRYPKGHLWSRGKFGATIGFADLQTEVNYVLHQEEHHSSSLIGN